MTANTTVSQPEVRLDKQDGSISVRIKLRDLAVAERPTQEGSLISSHGMLRVGIDAKYSEE